MSRRANIWVVDLEKMRGVLERKDVSVLEELKNRVIEENDWDAEEGEFLDEIGAEVIEQGNHGAEDAGFVMQGLVLLFDHELIGDGWNESNYAELVDSLGGLNLSEKANELIVVILTGRSPLLESVDCAGDDFIAACMSAEEGNALAEELYAREDLDDFENEDAVATLFNHLAPALEKKLEPGQGFMFTIA